MNKALTEVRREVLAQIELSLVVLRSRTVYKTRVVQSIALFGSMVANAGLSVISSVLTARALGPAHFGDLRFVQTVWALLSLVTTLGYLNSASRVLLFERDPVRSREIVGAVLIVTLAMGGAIMVLILALARPIDFVFHTQVSRLLIMLAPLMLFVSLRDALALVLQSLNKVYTLAFLNTVPPLLYVLSLAELKHKLTNNTLTILFLQQFFVSAVALVLILCLRPSLRGLKGWIVRITQENRTYGYPIYVGSAIAVASGYINRLAISYWVDITAVGFYSLALSLAEPLKMIPNSVATSSFRDFANRRTISRNIFAFTFGLSLLALLGAMVMFGGPLEFVYSKDFALVGPMARVAAIAAIMHGMGDFHKVYLSAHGNGRVIRNTSLLVGGANLIGFVLLVPSWGAWGALYCTVVASGAYMLFTLVNYYRFTRASK